MAAVREDGPGWARPAAAGPFRIGACASARRALTAFPLLAILAGCGPAAPPGPNSGEEVARPAVVVVPDDRSFTDVASFAADYWRRPIPPQGPPPATFSPLEGSLAPASCGTCHVRQYEDWQTAIHSRAYSPGLSGQLVNWEASSYQSVRNCIMCHAPLAEQSAQLPIPVGGFGTNPDFDPELQTHGLVCAACHVRAWKRYGAPRRGDGSLAPSPQGSPHGGVKRTPYFEDSRFCASCHQFDSPAANGKSLQNTYVEWQNSEYGRRGQVCQSCHMPDRRHLWRGIHDPEMVRSGITVEWILPERHHRKPPELALRLVNSGVGHRFPTYVTPQVVLSVQLLDGEGAPIVGALAESLIGRSVRAGSGGWIETSDTRVPPKGSVIVRIPLDRANARMARGRVEVRPDAFYERMFRGMLAGSLSDTSRILISRAHRRTASSPYVVFDDTLTLPASFTAGAVRAPAVNRGSGR